MRRPIHEAIIGKKHEAVSTILEAGADAHAKDGYGDTTIQYVARAGDIDVARVWLRATKDQQRMMEMAELLIIASVRSNAVLLLSWLLSIYPAASQYSTKLWKSPIYIATTHGHQNALRTLLLSCKATSASNPGFVKSISDCLPQAAIKDSAEMVQMLLECEGINVNQEKYPEGTALLIAVKKGATRIVELLLRHPDITVDVQTNIKETLLHHAAREGYPDVVALLLKQHSIDVNLRNNYGRTALHYAAGHGYTSVIALLLEHPTTEVNHPDNSGQAPALYAIRWGQLEALKLLLEHPRTAISHSDNLGKTMLHFAAEHGRVNIITYLLSVADINTRCKNKLGETPLGLAFLECHWTALRLLAEHEGVALPLVFNEVTGEWLNKDAVTLFSLTALMLERGEVVVDDPGRWIDILKLIVGIGGKGPGQRFIDTYLGGRSDCYMDSIMNRASH
jgi:ankyrin repeat protein